MHPATSDLRGLQRRLGVTRLADVTGLDRIGLPVIAAVRPLSLNITVSFGKGRTSREAAVSALMEAAELRYSETPPVPLRHGRFADLARAGAIDPNRLDPLTQNRDLQVMPFDWVAGEDLGSDAPCLVPWPVVSMDYSVKARSTRRHLKFGATGLAAGFDRDRAILHGLYEVIERACHETWNAGSDADRAASLLDLQRVSDPAVRDLVQRIEQAGLPLLAWDMTGPAGVPCYLAEIIDVGFGATTAFAQGAAADLSPAAALDRAIAEAVQVRLAYISGGRDDLDHSDYGNRFELTVANREWVAARLRPRRRLPAEPRATLPAAAKITELRKRLARAGYGAVIAVPLTAPGDPLQVVKVIVPALRDIREIVPRRAWQTVPA